MKTTNRHSLLFAFADTSETPEIDTVRFFLLLLIATNVEIAAILPTRDNRRAVIAVVDDVLAIKTERRSVLVAVAKTDEAAEINAVRDITPETVPTAKKMEVATMAATLRSRCVAVDVTLDDAATDALRWIIEDTVAVAETPDALAIAARRRSRRVEVAETLDVPVITTDR